MNIKKFINKNPIIQNEDHPNCNLCNNDRCHTEDYRVLESEKLIKLKEGLKSEEDIWNKQIKKYKLKEGLRE